MRRIGEKGCELGEKRGVLAESLVKLTEILAAFRSSEFKFLRINITFETFVVDKISTVNRWNDVIDVPIPSKY